MVADIPRYFTYNTTTRTLLPVVEFAVDLQPFLHRFRHGTAQGSRALYQVAGALLEDRGRSGSAATVDKHLKEAERIHLLVRHADSGYQGQQIVTATTTLEALATDPACQGHQGRPGDLRPAVASMLLRSGHDRDGVTLRPYETLVRFALRFDEVRPRAGGGPSRSPDEVPAGISVEEYAIACAPAPRAVPDRSTATTMSRLRQPDGIDRARSELIEDAVAGYRDHIRDAIQRAVGQGLSPRSVRDELDQVLSGGRQMRADQMGAAVEAARNGNAQQVEDAVLVTVGQAKWESHIDACATVLGYAHEVGLLELAVFAEHGVKVKRFRATAFAQRLLRDLPPLPADLTACTQHLRSIETFAEAYREPPTDLDSAHRDLIVSSDPSLVRWELYNGRSEAGTYELEATKACASLLELVEGWSPAVCLRTKFDSQLRVLRHAQGRGADAVLPLASGRDLLIEVSGNTGRHLIKMEYEPVSRHLRRRYEQTANPDTMMLIVTPEISAQFLYDLVSSMVMPDGTVLPIVLLDEVQLRRLGEARTPRFEQLLVELGELTAALTRLPPTEQRAQVAATCTQMSEAVDRHLYGITAPVAA